MAGLWLDQHLTVNADTVCSNKIGETQEMVGKHVEISLPEVASKTTDAEAMGTLTVPVLGQFENMEATIHHIGVDQGLAKMLAQQTLEIEVRWAEQVMKEDGSQTPVGCKAFLIGFPNKVVPQITVKPGEAVDVEIPYTITGYKLIVDGKELWDINRLTQKFVVDGVDYFASLSSVL